MCVWGSVCSLVGGEDEERERGDGHLGPLLGRVVPSRCVSRDHPPTPEGLLRERTHLRTTRSLMGSQEASPRDMAPQKRLPPEGGEASESGQHTKETGGQTHPTK